MDRFIQPRPKWSTLDLVSPPPSCDNSDTASGLCSCLASKKNRLLLNESRYLPCLASPRSAYKHAMARTLHPLQSNVTMADPLLRHLYACLPASTTPLASLNTRVSVSEALKRSQINVLQYHRSVAPTPERVLDAPGLLDDFYLHLLDWGPSNCLAVALGPSVYIWNAMSGSVSELTTLRGLPASEPYISSLKWVQTESDPPILAVGTSEGTVQLWNVPAEKRLRDMQYLSAKPPPASSSDQAASHRVSSLAWNNSLLSSGHRSGHIFHSDVRVARHQVAATTKAHDHDVCGLAWSPDGTQLASGGNDNVLNVWEGLGSLAPRHCLAQHTAAVKAIAWCPWRSRLLASGGGSADQTIRTWNTTTGTCLSSTRTGSQVTSLLWSPDSHSELISSHGFSDNQIVVWRYPSMTRLTELKGHAGRIVSLAMSPNGRTVVSAGADENLNFWAVYPECHRSPAKRALAPACNRAETPSLAARKTLGIALPSPPTLLSSPSASSPSYRNTRLASPSRFARSSLPLKSPSLSRPSRSTLPALFC